MVMTDSGGDGNVASGRVVKVLVVKTECRGGSRVISYWC